MRYLLIISYDGTNFCGYQLQKKVRTVQAELEHAIEIMSKEKVDCVASGRTDAGVHAMKQYVHFDIDQSLDLKKSMRSLNGILPDDIRVLEIKETDLHCRFSAKKKTYLYKMYMSDIDLPLYKNRALKVAKNLNVDVMKKVCKLLIGEHDFKAFCASNCEVKTTTRKIYDCKIEENNGEINFFITGNGFLYKMVRNIVGLLIQTGEGKIENEQQFLNIAFENGDDTNPPLSKHTMPPYALYLFDVAY